MAENLELFPHRRHRIFLNPDVSQQTFLHARPKKLKGKLVVSVDELRSHNDLMNEGWMAINGVVYDISQYAQVHPGGLLDIQKAVGDDGTDLFKEYHAYVNPVGFLQNWKIGGLKNYNKTKFNSTKKLHKSWLDAKIETINPLPQTYNYHIVLKFEKEVAKLITMVETKVCPFHCILRIRTGNKFITRPFSPLRSFTDQSNPLGIEVENRLNLVVKLYELGHFSKKLQKQDIDVVQVGFVISHLRLAENRLTVDGMRGRFKAKGDFERLGVVAAGTGVLPVIQILQTLRSSAPEVEISVIICAKTEKDVLFLSWFKSLDVNLVICLSEKTITDHSEVYVGKFGSGLFSKFPNCLPRQNSSSDESVRILLSGPPGFEQYGPKDNKSILSVEKILKREGWSGKVIESL